jgi:hypothetical protein
MRQLKGVALGEIAKVFDLSLADAIASECPGIPRPGIEQRIYGRVHGCKCEAARLVSEGKV